MASLTIDAHHHFWDPSRADYPWMTEDLAILRRVFAPADLRPELAANRVDKTVLVQTLSSLDETREFLAIAGRTDFVAGVIGWVDLTDPAIDRMLSDLRSGPNGWRLVGIRHQVHDEPDADWLRRADVRRGLAAVARHGLAYDLLIRPRELPAALDTVSALPELRFVVDHLAKPAIRDEGFDAWQSGIAGFATERAHVWCKLSGMVTEADWADWRRDDLRPYVREALRVFGPARCLFGSDWPVCLLAASYGEVKAALLDCLDGLTPAERDQVLGGAAIEVYRLAEIGR
ncbi:MAG TPA: amidohydrolase family protein [Stellaceae bacterium]|nr:amidohydrolase family protein [Stellaceae bacterium]